MDKFKEALIEFTRSNPSLFRNDAPNSYPRLIQQRFSQFFADFRTPSHPPYAAMIHRAIWELNEKGGSSEESISKFIKQEYVDLPWAHSTLLKHHLEKLCDREEIFMTRKQCYLLAGTDSEPISSSGSEKPLKRKHNLESGKKSRRHHKKHKKQKSGQDSEAGKTSSKQRNKYKKKDECQLDLQETNKQIIEDFVEQDQALQPLNGVADEQENVMCNGLHEPQCLKIENETYGQGNRLIDTFVPEMEEGSVPATAAEENQLEIEKDSMGEKVYASTHFDDTGNENQSVQLADDKEQIEIHGTKKGWLKRKQGSMSQRKNSKRGKKHEMNEETQLQALSEATFEHHEEATDGHSHEQNQMTEVNMTDIEIKDQNQLERRTNDVVEEVDKDGENTQESHPDNSGNISFGQIQMKQNPQLLQLEESPGFNPLLLKSQHPGKRVCTRSQLKKVSPGYAYVPKDDFDPVEYLSEEKQQVMEIIKGKKTKQAPSAVSNKMNGQRAKLRSSQKNTGELETMESLIAPLLQMEPQQKSRSPSLERPLKELLNPMCTKLRSQSPDLDEPATTPSPSSTKVQEPGSSDQSDESEDEPKYKGRGRHPKHEKDEVLSDSRSAAIPKKGRKSAKKRKVRRRHPKRKRVEGEVLCNSKSTDSVGQVKQSHSKDEHKYEGRCRRHKPEKDELFCINTSSGSPKRGEVSNEEDQPKRKWHGKHKMRRRSSRKKKGPSR